jgi:hypothetical protein
MVIATCGGGVLALRYDTEAEDGQAIDDAENSGVTDATESV